MQFKNIFIYQLPDTIDLTPETLEAALALKPLQPCTGLDKQTRGWVPCRAGGTLVHAAGEHMLFTLGTEQKKLPISYINRMAKERIAGIEEQQGYKVGRKEAKDIKEAIADELLPNAFPVQRSTSVWLDMANKRLIVDAGSSSKAEEVLEFLNKTMDALPASLLKTDISPSTAMTNWLIGDNVASGFTIDRELVLRSGGESKSTVRYANHTLEGEVIMAYIAEGKRATRLGMTWNDRISFIFTEEMQIKRIEFLEIIKEEATTQADNADELFELDFVLMTGELSKMLNDLLAALKE